LGRERNVNAKILMAASDVVAGDRKSHGNTKQLQKTAVTAGHHLKASQAFSIVKARSQHTVEYHLASYWYLNPTINCLKAGHLHH